MILVQLKAVLLDLDGTLVDTAPDLVAVLNAILKENGQSTVPYAIARIVVSEGARGLLRLGFGSSLSAAEEKALRKRFLDLYLKHKPINSILFKPLSRYIPLNNPLTLMTVSYTHLRAHETLR